MLELTHTVDARQMREQVLDSMDLERERGITIKAQAVRIDYKASDGLAYVFNLIDTPGHVDFTYEVSRTLAACEGALLVVDASQGVEAQTIANAYLAMDAGLEIIPVINKVDLPSAAPERVKAEIEDSLGIDCSEALMVSAKSGEGVEELLEAIAKRVPPPSGDPGMPLKALVFDSAYDVYRGVVVFVRVFDGVIAKGAKVKMMATGNSSEVEEVGTFAPEMTVVPALSAGDVGYVITGIKSTADIKPGDTMTDADRPTAEPCLGYKEAKPMVFCGIYPLDGGRYENLREALQKLTLNDPALSFEPETSLALGFGFRCGFLGLLHMEIVEERLEREYGLELLATAPSVAYRVNLTDGNVVIIRSPSEMPEVSQISSIEEPYINATVLTPPDYIGPVMELCQGRRGQLIDIKYLGQSRAQIKYDLPLGEIVLDFYDQLKSWSKGYASLDYELAGYRETKLVKLDILLAGEPVDALSAIVPHEKAFERGKVLCERLRQIIPRQMFNVAIQAAIGGKIIARETVQAKRKDVIAKCYGGDISRKRKLLQKQKAGKKRMKQVGSVNVPQEAFLAVLRVDDGD